MNMLKDYRYALQKSAFWLLVISGVVAALSYGVMNRLGVRHEVHFSYLVSLTQREQAPDYTFDGYYALQATDLFSTTLAALITTPEVVIAAIKEAHVTLPSSDPFALRSLVTATKEAPQLVHVTIKHSDQSMAEKIKSGLEQVVAKEIHKYDTQGTPALSFTIVATDPWTATQEPNALLVALITFLVVAFLGVNTVLFVTSLKKL